MSHCILLCEDETHILRAAEFKLKRAGFEILCANNGRRALEILHRRRPDLLITDCQMPELDGFGLLTEIRKDPKLADLPVVMLTAKGYELSLEDLQQRFGILDLLIKPFSPRELVTSVEGYLKRCASANSGGT